MPDMTKIATCSYCGTRSVLHLSGKVQHELACTSCGARLHEMKHLRKPAKVEPRPAKVTHHRPAQTQSRKTRKRRRPEPLIRRMADLFEDIFDEIEDIFD